MTTGNTGNTGDPHPYRDAITELDRILDVLDRGGIDVDELIGLVERAAELILVCRTRVDRARLRVDTVLTDLDEDRALPQEPDT